MPDIQLSKFYIFHFVSLYIINYSKDSLFVNPSPAAYRGFLPVSAPDRPLFLEMYSVVLQKKPVHHGMHGLLLLCGLLDLHADGSAESAVAVVVGAQGAHLIAVGLAASGGAVGDTGTGGGVETGKLPAVDRAIYLIFHGSGVRYAARLRNRSSVSEAKASLNRARKLHVVDPKPR